MRRYGDIMRISLRIDDDVEPARQLAASHGKSIGAVISDLARRSLQPTPIRRDHGFPVFDVPNNAPIVTADDVARALGEDVELCR
jgi:hypothetical protein